MEFDLTYYHIEVEHVNHNTTKTPLFFFIEKKKVNDSLFKICLLLSKQSKQKSIKRKKQNKTERRNGPNLSLVGQLVQEKEKLYIKNFWSVIWESLSLSLSLYIYIYIYIYRVER